MTNIDIVLFHQIFAHFYRRRVVPLIVCWNTINESVDIGRLGYFFSQGFLNVLAILINQRCQIHDFSAGDVTRSLSRTKPEKIKRFCARQHELNLLIRRTPRENHKLKLHIQILLENFIDLFHHSILSGLLFTGDGHNDLVSSIFFACIVSGSLLIPATSR
ncbi:hypothetical protein D3C73_770440 [compost metagenome]